MANENDISWQVLRQVVRNWAGNSAELAEVKPLVGGSINTTLRLRTAGGQRAVIKISPHRVNRRYEEERLQLGLLRDAGVPVPQVYHCQLASLDFPHSYLLMEFIEGVDLGRARRECSSDCFNQLQEHLAELVNRMHACTSDAYHRCIPGEVPKFDDWPAFFHEVYDSIWQEVEKSGVLPVKSRKAVNKVHRRLDRLIEHDDQPRLSHGDLWSTNLLCAAGESGRWRINAVLDPNCKYMHADAEIAYLELFGTITPAFLKVYQSDRQLSRDYARLHRPVYQMYHLLNHVRLFGGDYVKLLVESVERVSSLV